MAYINSTFFTVLAYPMSYLEFFGTVFNLASVTLMTRRNILTWPTGILGVILFAITFYQIRLYADVIEQVYYFFVSIYGWWFFTAKKEEASLDRAGFSSFNQIGLGILITLAFTALFALFLLRAHQLFPIIFPEAASYPWIDALTTVMGFVAMILMARGRSENWVYWIIVNILCIWLYYVKNIKFISLLYFIFLLLAFAGLYQWEKNRIKKLLRREHASV